LQCTGTRRQHPDWLLIQLVTVPGAAAVLASHFWRNAWPSTWSHMVPHLQLLLVAGLGRRHHHVVPPLSVLCQGENYRENTSSVQPIAVPSSRFSHLHMDLLRPLPATADGT
jgi:hypothetical protein